MSSEILHLLSSVSQQVFAYCQSESGISGLSVKQRSTLGEAGLSISQALLNLRLPSHERTLLEKAFNRVFSVVYDESALFYYSSFYYSYKEVQKDANKVQMHFIKANFDVLAMRIKLAAIKLGFASFGTSTDNYFLDRLSGLVVGIEYVFKNRKTEYFVTALYALLNLHQVLLDFQENGIANKSEVSNKLNSVHITLEKVLTAQETQNIISNSPQAKYFLTEQLWRYAKLNSKSDVQDFEPISFEKLDWIPQLRCLGSISKYKPDEFVKGCEICFPKWKELYAEAQPHAKILLFNILTQWQKIINHHSSTELNILFKSENIIDPSSILSRFFSGYDKIKQTKVSSDELEKLYKFDDGQLRQRLGNSLKDIDPVIISRESTKYHGVSEIADMELPLRLYADKTHYLCMPFKSAREISTTSVPVQYSYQIMRPFAYFENCVVIFVTAKKCSEPLMNEIKLMKEKFNWSIGVLENESLAALLKLNGQLQS